MANGGGRVLVGTISKQHGARISFEYTAPPQRDPARRPSRVARMLALAHHVQRAIDSGTVADRAAMAAELRLTRARVTQLLDLLLLAPDIQEAILSVEAVDGVEPFGERHLRPLTRCRSWADQRERWAALTSASASRCESALQQ